MQNNILKKITDREFISGIPALICLLFFQWTLYFALVGTNEDNLLPIRHGLEVYMPKEELESGKKSNQTGGQSADAHQETPEYIQIVGYAPYETDSVEVVKGHFGVNITTQLLVLSILAIIFFVIFRKMGIYPAPFLIPLFIILTVSIFYHNYLGHRITDKVYLKSLECVGNCDSGNVTVLRCSGNKCWNCSKNPDANECIEKATKLKELKIDGRKKDKALKTYPTAYGKFISLDKEDPDEKESGINKYKRGANDSKTHFLFIIFGLCCFFAAMIFAKIFSKIKNFDDYEFRFLVILSIVACVIGGIIAKKFGGVTSLVEFLKLLAILLTVVGYEKINKNLTNLVHYIILLVFEMGVLFFVQDFGNLLILGIIVGLVFFLTFPWKKIFLIAAPFLVVVLIICGYFFYKYIHPDGNMLWRLKDTWSGLTEPTYKCTITGGDEKLVFFSKDRSRAICYKKNDKNETTGFVMVKNCEPMKDNAGFKECDIDREFSKGDDDGTGKIQCNAKNNYHRQGCEQVDTDPRLAMFAILKDGFFGGHTGFKENTFLLNNRYMYTDFVFCGLIAFFGIGLTFLVVVSLIILIWNCNIKPKECGNNYKHFLYSNIMVIILATQAVIHIGGNLNVLPFTGVILPFLSKGGASTIVAFITLGLALGGLVSDDFTYRKSAKFIMAVSDKLREPFKNFCRKHFQKSSAEDNDISSTNYEDTEQVNYE